MPKPVTTQTLVRPTEITMIEIIRIKEHPTKRGIYIRLGKQYSDEKKAAKDFEKVGTSVFGAMILDGTVVAAYGEQQAMFDYARQTVPDKVTLLIVDALTDEVKIKRSNWRDLTDYLRELSQISDEQPEPRHIFDWDVDEDKTVKIKITIPEWVTVALLAGGKPGYVDFRSKLADKGILLRYWWEYQASIPKKTKIPVDADIVLINIDNLSHSETRKIGELANKAGVPLVAVGNTWQSVEPRIVRYTSNRAVPKEVLEVYKLIIS